MPDQQQALDQILGQIKAELMRLLNETADEFDERELTDDQRQVYNDFTSAFGNKILAIKLEAG